MKSESLGEVKGGALAPAAGRGDGRTQTPLSSRYLIPGSHKQGLQAPHTFQFQP